MSDVNRMSAFLEEAQVQNQLAGRVAQQLVSDYAIAHPQKLARLLMKRTFRLETLITLGK